MNIKVSGITQLKQLQQLDGLEIDFAGLVFIKDSPLFAGDKIDKAAIKNADFDLKKVGIFLNPEMIDVLDAIDEYGLDVVQLNGNESVEMCEDISAEVEVIKSFNITDGNANIDKLVAAYDGVCDYYLFNMPKDGAEKFDWKALGKAKIEKPFFISGNVDIEDLTQLKSCTHPDYFGIDIGNKFEKETGVKDMGLILQFMQGLKSKL